MAPEPGVDGEVWRIDLDRLSVGAAADAAFEDFERGRLARFRFAHDARRYRAAHWALRLVLAAPLGRAPTAVRLRQDELGKPHVRPDQAVGFNLSHSGGIGVVAWCRGRAVGVDVECRRPLADVDLLAASLLAPDETRAWQRLDALAKSEAFLLAWTRKEAAAKALGSGLTIEPRAIEAGLDGQRRQWCWGDATVQLEQTHLAPDSIVSLAWQCVPA